MVTETISKGGTSTETINHLYYDQNGNVLEERLQSPSTATAVTDKQYVWSLLGGNFMTLFDSANGNRKGDIPNS